MTTMLTKFQARSVDDLLLFSKKLLAKSALRTILLEAPTGSGKTVMTSIWLDRLATELGSLSFVWLAPNKLHEQSLARMQAASEHLPSLTFIEPASLGRSLAAGEVLFLNWDSVNKKGNTLRKTDGHERGLTLDSVLTATREEGKKIVLVVDESHVHVSAEAAQEVIHEIIRPDLTLEVSATPNIQRYDSKVTVDREEVVAEGLIRKEVVINPGMSTVIGASNGSDSVTIQGGGDAKTVLQEALAMRNRLARTFREKGVGVNPLLLVQFPDAAAGDKQMGDFEDLLAKEGVTTSNGKLAVWLSDEKVNLENIETSMGGQEVLFFKQAIALGWDCPRAQVLVALRELKVNSFTAQVLGRILRQPLRKHFELDLLDRAYVFTNVDSFKLTADLEGILPCREVRQTQPLKLPITSWVEASGSKGFVALRSLSDMILEDAAEFIDAHNLRHRGPVLGHMVSDIIIRNPDESVLEHGTACYALGLDQLESGLSVLVNNFATTFQNTGNARRIIRTALIDLGCLAAEVSSNLSDTEVVRKKALECLLHETNRPYVETRIGEAVNGFVADKERKARELEPRDEWVAPILTTVRASLRDRWKKSLFSCYSKEFTDIEQALAEHFEGDTSVAVWVKNGDSGRDWFAINYEQNGQPKLFYPDFIVVHTDGSIVIAEGKGNSSNGTAASADTKLKADRLQEWAAIQREAGHAVTGFVAVLSGSSIFVNDDASYSFSSELKGWKKLKG